MVFFHVAPSVRLYNFNLESRLFGCKHETDHLNSEDWEPSSIFSNSTEIYFQWSWIYNKTRHKYKLQLSLSCESSGTAYHDALLKSKNIFEVSVFAFITCESNSY